MADSPNTAVSDYVSAVPEFVNGDNAYPQVADLISLGDGVERRAGASGISTMANLYDGSHFTWEKSEDIFIQSDEFTNELTNFFNIINRRTVPPSVLIKIPQAYIGGAVIYVAEADKRKIVYETNRGCDRVVNRIRSHADFANADHRFAGSNGTAYFQIGSTGYFNYGHWLVDDLPRAKALWLLAGLPNIGRVCALLPCFSADMDKVRLDSLRCAVGNTIDVEFYDADRLYRIDDLYYATPVTYHPLDKSPDAMAYVADLAPNVATRDRKLFVARTATQGRFITNFPDVQAVLEEAGFETVDPGAMSFTQQSSLFAGAGMVFGVMGAAMTNTIFCAPGTKVTYLAPRGWIEPFYLDLAAVRQLRYRVLYGPPTDVAIPAHTSSFAVSIPELRQAISEQSSG